MEGNLYDVTLKILKENGYSFENVLGIQGNDYQILIDNFIKVAKRTDITQSGINIAEDLTIIGINFIIKWETDSMGWQGKWMFTNIKLKTRIEDILNLQGKHQYISLSDMNITPEYNEEDYYIKHGSIL